MAGDSWAHSCCSVAGLAAALENEGITAIETDIIISGRTGKPVMAHPVSKGCVKHAHYPSPPESKKPAVAMTGLTVRCLQPATDSDLTFEEFWRRAVEEPTPGSKRQKHVKVPKLPHPTRVACMI